MPLTLKRPTVKTRRDAPLETVSPTEHRQTRVTSESAECPRCDKPVAGAAIITEKPEQATAFLHFVERRFYCDGCNHVVHWLQHCNADGAQLGDIIEVDGTKFDIIRGKAVEDFLRAHPEATGVAQVAQ